MSTTDTVTESLEKETQRKRRLVARSWWPRARLIGEILYHEIYYTHTFSQAAALTYKTLFSLLPVFVLTLLLLSTISSAGGGSALDATLQQFVFKQLSLDKLKVTRVDPASTTTAPDAEEDQPTTQETSAQDFAAPIIKSAKDAVTNPATGLVAFGILLYGSISLMIVIEGTFNLIYGAVKPRSWPRRVMLYWCVLTLGPVAIVASILLGRTAYQTASSFAGGWILIPLNVAAAFLLTWSLVVTMYKLIPDTRVNWKSAMLGATVAAVLWELGKFGFGLYVRRAVAHSWYGSLALLPLFMLWIYLTWCAILLGLQVAYLHQFFPLLRRRYFFTQLGANMLSDVHWIFSLGVLLYERFKAGKGLATAEAAELLMLPNDATGQLLEGLRVAGLVHTTKRDTYALARPAESITAHDLLIAARAICHVPPELAKELPTVRTYPDTPALRELEELQAKWAKTRTLNEMAESRTNRPGEVI